MTSSQTTDKMEKTVRFTVTVTEYCDYDYAFFHDDCREYFDIHDEKVIKDLWKRLLRRKKPIHLGKVAADRDVDPHHPMRGMLDEMLEEMKKK